MDRLHEVFAIFWHKKNTVKSMTAHLQNWIKQDITLTLCVRSNSASISAILQIHISWSPPFNRVRATIIKLKGDFTSSPHFLFNVQEQAQFQICWISAFFPMGSKYIIYSIQSQRETKRGDYFSEIFKLIIRFLGTLLFIHEQYKTSIDVQLL